jgi:hypothetical protein
MIKSLFITFLFTLSFCTSVFAQDQGSMALSPARFELEMKPGTETTVVLSLDYRSGGSSKQPARILATLNDWTMTADGQIEYFPANTRPRSAASWMVYTPGEAAVTPGSIHQIRVTISVPMDAAPGDHLAALLVEQRPDTRSDLANQRKMVVRYRMASVFYIKVAGGTRHGEFQDLLAETTDTGFLVKPTLRNTGSSMLRPSASLKVIDASGNIVADVPEIEPLPILAGAELRQSVMIDGKQLAPGKYTVKYRVDFQDGTAATEGVTELIVPQRSQIAAKPVRP